MKTAVADGVSLARVIRMTVFPSSMGSWPKMARDLEAVRWTGLVS
jgi:hypothetical protein